MTRVVKSTNNILMIFWIVLFVFRDLLSEISPVFSYIDEAPLLIFVIKMAVKTLQSKRIIMRKGNGQYIFAICLFVMVGLLGNIIYRYQTVNLVIVDLLTNLKFFGALAYFGELTCKDSGGGSRISQLSCLLTVFLFMLFLLDRVLNVFPSDYRYGIKATRLFFNHPTYLAGICVFLIALMTIYNVEKNLPYIGMNMIMMIFTLRSKAIVSAVLFVVLYVVIVKLHAKLKVWQMVIVGIVCIVCAWSQIYFYFVFLGGQSARSVMLFTSFKIMKDYFPIGTGFGCYASHSAAVNYSPVYIKYGFNYIYELRNAAEGTFFDDQFWPIIFGQTGVIGTAAYICILVFLFRKVQKLFKVNLKTYTAALVVFIYLLVSSTAEPTFNNAVAIPLAMVLEICYSQADQYRNAQKSVKKRGMK